MRNRLDQQGSTSSMVYKPWSAFGRTNVLMKWAEELRACCSSADQSAAKWQLTGRAVLIAHPDQEHHAEIVAKIANESGMRLIEWASEEFVEKVNTNNVPENNGPSIIYVSQGNWSAKYTLESETPAVVSAFRDKLQQYLADIDPAQSIVFITTGLNYYELDPSLRTVGLFDRRFVINEISIKEKGDHFLDAIGRNVCDSTLLDYPQKVGRLIEEDFADKRRRDLIALALSRLAYRENRKLNFDDLIYFVVHGSGESDLSEELDQKALKNIAIHEAGHALVSIIDSDAENLPDHIGIVRNSDSRGQVADSYEYVDARAGKHTYADLRHKIRVSLAGRAAESLVLGALNVSAFSSCTDLRNATELAKDLIGIAGFSSGYEVLGGNHINLAVKSEDPTPSELAHIETEARKFLSIQYQAVQSMLSKHRAFLDNITVRLLEKKVLNQTDITAVWNEYRQSLSI